MSVNLPVGGFTVNQIHIKDVNGKPRLTLPLSERLHPYITLRGELKQAVYDAIEEAYAGTKKCAEPGRVRETAL